MIKENNLNEPDICPYFYDEPLCKKEMNLTELTDYCSSNFEGCVEYKILKGVDEKNN